MTPFTLATLRTPNGPQAALGVGPAYHLLHTLQPVRHLTTRTLLDEWDTAFPMLEELAEEIAANKIVGTTRIEKDAAQLETPVMYPDNLFAVGGNYSGHLKEMGLEVKKWAAMPFFTKPPKATLVGPGETVRIPRSTKQFDWELELIVFVGKRLRHASKEEAASAVAGYAVGLDLSCRDLMKVDNDIKVDLVRGKGQDTMAPCGPYIVPAQFVPDPYDLRLQLWVNDEPMMDARSSEMIYHIDEMLSIISEYLTIEPGDMLFSGSPAGSASVHGNRWLQPGDRIRAEISEVGGMEVVMRQD